MRERALALGACLTIAAGCHRTDAASVAYVAELDAWHAERRARLAGEEGWLSLVGLHWLSAGEQALGSGAECALRLPEGRAAARVGTLIRDGEAVSLRVAPGVAVTVDGRPVELAALQSDRDGEPSRLEHRRLVMTVIARGDRLALRVRDRDRPAEVGVPKLPRFPPDPAWRIEARWEPHDPPRSLVMPTAIGTVEEAPSPGTAVFAAGGREHRLTPTAEGDELFFVFGDQTNGRSTYGGGRFLLAAAPRAGRVVLDFNRAYNPPCVFTPYATCPLPPRQNRLDLAVEAGELVPGGH